MRHKLKTLCAISTITVFASSCTKEMMTQEGFNEALFVKTTITADATLPGTDSTASADKAFVEDSTRKVIWQAGDQLKINNAVLTVASIDSGGVRAKFYGTVPALVSGSNYRYWAVYPTNLASSISDTSQLIITLPDIQTIDTSKNALEGYNFMAGHAVVPPTASSVHFQMRNLGTVLKLQLTADSADFSKRVDSIVFTSNTNLTGAFTIPNTLSSDSNFTISQGGTGSNKLKVVFSGGGLDISSQKTIYVFLPPLSNNSLNMRLYGGYGLSTYVEKNAAAITLNRNKINTYTNNSLTFDHYFSISSSKRVIFSPGNLQWSRTNGTDTNTTHNTATSSQTGYDYGTWRFAKHQWDFVGCHKNHTWGNVYGVGGNANTKCSNDRIASDYKGWIDLFGWGTSGYKKKFPYMTSTTSTDYGDGKKNISNTNYDWGVYNAIDNPCIQTTYAPGTWRTLTSAEWEYILFTRTTSSGIRYAKAVVNGVVGLILLPDDWNASTYTPNSYNTTNAKFRTNIMSATQWLTLEGAGAIFLPTTLYRKGTNTPTACEIFDANYWASAEYVDKEKAQHPLFDSLNVKIKNGCDRALGHGVRLARDM